jgi:phage-related protein
MGVRDYFSFDGRRSTDFGLYINGSGTYKTPERKVEIVSVPGRNGDLVYDSDAYENVEVEYKDCGFGANFRKGYEDFRSFMLSRTGYKVLFDSYDPDHFRKALFTGPLSPDMETFLRTGTVTVTFNCQPQRWLALGEDAIDLTTGGTIVNPTYYRAAPLLQITRGTSEGVIEMSTGSKIHVIRIKSDKDEPITATGKTFTLDCATLDAYGDGTNANVLVTLSDDDLTLGPGDAKFTVTGVEKLIVKPRWWTI